VLIICNVQGTWLVCSSLTANSGPAKIYPLIYHQVLHVIIFNVQGTCLVCSNLTATVDLSMVTLNTVTRVSILDSTLKECPN
jgi:hypothetical protein